ncbi:SusD/RagB family nutrient-binding outer membrane lipoprotein [Chitinophaga agrisoli]|uniref:SusD/RagB family nutrient-binding outer membrane lipoprotein n=1 Tax=Chitinophaga agrisoli TaxID=2607653 RepID=A0A5B2W123_9BACT|nr:RagB/SusD family nutrient uptake outer membrane protein [Chitinophaga agrisoli]KAA2244450.1 SusD/RagB family nutrient-binding outer membrane lipoprotein [Chitinophaga agrisoli]
MKRYLSNINKPAVWNSMLLAGTVLLGASSCTKNFERYNSDNTGVNTNLESLIRHEQRAIYNFSGGGDPNSFQLQQNLNADCFSGYMMSANPFGGNTNMNYALVSGWNGEPFKVVYLDVLAYVAQMKQLKVDEQYPPVWAVAQITKITAMDRATDIYGPLPYSQAGGNKTGIPYDSQKDIYNSFFTELDEAVASLKSFISSGQKLPFDFGAIDLVYGGDFNRWLQFANSLRLRLAMHIVKVDAVTAKAQADKALDPAAGGVITANSGNMNIQIVGAGFDNPLVHIAQSWTDINIGASIQAYMSGYNDPRIGKYMDKSTDALPALNGQYKGIRIGSTVLKNDYVTYSTLNFKDGKTPSFNSTTPVQIMTAAEVYFLRAEAALRGWTSAGGTAQALYETGIQTSLDQWGVADANYITDATSKPAAYADPKNAANNSPALSDITIKWEEGVTPERKLERIMTQKWIAMFPEGQEAWTEFRRTGYPKLFPVVNNNSGGLIDSRIQVRRLQYPQNEYNTNAAELNKGIQLLGGADNGGTRLWWDVNKGNF